MENDLYDLNNTHSTKKTNWYSIDGKERQMFYKQKNNINESRFITGNISETHELLKSDCEIINEFLFHYYDFDLEKNRRTIIQI